MRRVHVCSKPGCPNLSPCEVHARPQNAAWSDDRDHAAHLKQRRQLIKTRGPCCERCGWTTDNTGKGLQMHHISPTQVVLVCTDCHRTLDPQARNPHETPTPRHTHPAS